MSTIKIVCNKMAKIMVTILKMIKSIKYKEHIMALDIAINFFNPNYLSISVHIS